jgi:hypothetical protein
MEIENWGKAADAWLRDLKRTLSGVLAANPSCHSDLTRVLELPEARLGLYDAAQSFQRIGSLG